MAACIGPRVPPETVSQEKRRPLNAAKKIMKYPEQGLTLQPGLFPDQTVERRGEKEHHQPQMEEI